MTKEIFDNNDNSLEGYGSDDIYNGKIGRKKQQLNSNPIKEENEYEKNDIQKLREENPVLSFELWSSKLVNKYLQLLEKVNEYFPEMLLPLDFAISIKMILNVKDITLPFMGIVFAVPSSMKTQVFELFRRLNYSYFTDKFTAKSFVSHSATVPKEKLKEIDMLPRIKGKILLTPELSPLFTGKDDEIKEQFGVITRILDGKGLETESGVHVHGQRGYHGDYMFTWLGAAVDIPNYIYKFLSTIGFKIFFLRLPRTEVTTEDLVEQLLAEKLFNEKIKEIEELLIDYLNWFEICPISMSYDNIAKIEWNKSKDDRDAITIIAELSLLLARLRGNVAVYKSSNTEDFIPSEIKEDVSQNANTNYHTTEFIHGLATIETPTRAAAQLYNLARGHALSQGRNYIIKDDISLVIKVVLSTGSIERVLVLDFLIANKGSLTTSQISAGMKMSNSTAKKTMTEFKGLELVSMKRITENSNSEYKIILNPKFEWFLTEEFKELRDDFRPADNKEYIKSKSNSKNSKGEIVLIPKNENICCDDKTPPVLAMKIFLRIKQQQ